MKTTIPKLIMLVMGLLPMATHSQAKSFGFGQLDSLQKVDKRIAIAFIHADWCGYCQAMKQTTFKAKEVIKMLDVHYWFIQLNAEEKSRIRFKGNTYGFKPTGNNTGTHGLAAEFASLDGRISYPRICFLDPNHKVILRYGQFISGDDLLKLLEEMKRIYN